MNATLEVWSPEARAMFEQARTVKPRLTVKSRPRRRTRPVEVHAFGQMVSRMIKAYGRRVQDADVEDLADMFAMRAQLDDVITSTITTMRAKHEFSWARIGEAAGTTRQAAQMRYGKGQA